jgi:hypothetical protein
MMINCNYKCYYVSKFRHLTLKYYTTIRRFVSILAMISILIVPNATCQSGEWQYDPCDCNPNNDFNVDPQVVFDYYENLGFLMMPIQILGVAQFKSDTDISNRVLSQCEHFYANELIVLNGQQIFFPSDFEVLCQVDPNQAIFVTNNDDFDNGNLAVVESEFNQQYNATWIHVLEYDCNYPGTTDYLAIFSKDISISEMNCPVEDIQIATENGSFDYFPSDNTLNGHAFSLIQRTFGPWVDFGHFQLPLDISGVWRENSFKGDNRTFSLDDTKQYTGGVPANSVYNCNKSGSVTSRTHHLVEFELGQLEVQCEDIYSSGTLGALNFNILQSGSTSCDWNCELESQIVGVSSINNNSIYLHSEGKDDCVSFARNIDIRTKLSFLKVVENGKEFLLIQGITLHKGFPAAEIILEDAMSNRLFLYTYSPNSEAELINELWLEAYDFRHPISVKVEFDFVTGGFLQDMRIGSVDPAYSSVHVMSLLGAGINECIAQILANQPPLFQYTSTTVAEWNQSVLNSVPSGDCASLPCCGILGSCPQSGSCN